MAVAVSAAAALVAASAAWAAAPATAAAVAVGGNRRFGMRSAFALRINQGKNIYNFGIPERLRTLRYSIFTGGVVEKNGICRAAFYESAALRASACSPLGELSRSD